MRLLDEVLQKTLVDVVLGRCLVLWAVMLEAKVHVFIQLGAHLILLVPESAIPVIFYGVVGAAQQDVSDFGPSILSTPL